MIYIYALTAEGKELAKRLKEQLAVETNVFVLTRYQEEGLRVIEPSLKESIQAHWQKGNQFIMIMATGIVVRTIADFIEHKQIDPAVLVMDQRREFVIPLLSGHLGGANQLARKVHQVIGATPVITTATDVQHMPAFDLIAQKNHCYIENIEHLKTVSAEILDGKKVKCYSSVRINFDIDSYKECLDIYTDFEQWHQRMLTGREIGVLMSEKILECVHHFLTLRPKNIVLGIGCRRGTTKKAIESAVNDFLHSQNISPKSIAKIVSIDLKKDEEGIIAYAKENDLKFETYSIDELQPIIIKYAVKESAFVKKQIGIGAVALPAAIKGAVNPKVIANKTRYKGITLSLVKDESVQINI